MWSGAQHRHLGRLRLLDLEDHLGLVEDRRGVGQRCARPAPRSPSSGIALPTPAPDWMNTSWPCSTSSRTPAGVSATRYSSVLISVGTPTFIAALLLGSSHVTSSRARSASQNSIRSRALEVAPRQLLDPPDPVAQRVAVAVELARRALPLPVLLDERLERAHQLVAVLAARVLERAEHAVAVEPQRLVVLEREEELEGAEVAVRGDRRRRGRSASAAASSAQRASWKVRRSEPTGRRPRRRRAQLAVLAGERLARAARPASTGSSALARVDDRAQQALARRHERAHARVGEEAVEVALRRAPRARRRGRRRRAPRRVAPTPNGRSRIASSSSESRPVSASASTSPASRRSVSRIARWRISSSATTVTACWRIRRSKSPSPPASRAATSHACGAPRPRIDTGSASARPAMSGWSGANSRARPGGERRAAASASLRRAPPRGRPPAPRPARWRRKTFEAIVSPRAESTQPPRRRSRRRARARPRRARAPRARAARAACGSRSRAGAPRTARSRAA